MRIDRALQVRGLVRSRTHAQSLIVDGRVSVDGVVITKSSYDTDLDTAVVNVETVDTFVSRGAHKLVGALDRFAPRGLTVQGKTALDAGASTGGFTQVLVERGAVSVLAVDVGHGQLAPEISADPRVDAREGVNMRDFLPGRPEERRDIVVADLSFISLTLVVPILATWLVPGGNALLMVKPQFEVGQARLDKHGVVRDDDARADAVQAVATAVLDEDLAILDVARSQLSGPRGNVEFFIWCAKAWQAEGDDVAGRDTRPALDEAGLSEAIRREVKGAT